MMDKETVARWRDHPLTKYVRATNPDMALVDQLVEQLRLMNELEEVFPGIPFEQIFDTVNTATDRDTAMVRRIRRGLRLAGVNEETIEQLTSYETNGRSTPSGHRQTLPSTRFSGYAERAALARQYRDEGWTSRKAFRLHHGLAKGPVDRMVQLLKPLAEEKWELGLLALQPNSVWSALAEEFGCSPYVVGRYAEVVRFQTEDIEEAA